MCQLLPTNSFILSNIIYCEEPDKYIPAVLCMCSHLWIFKDLSLMSGIEKSNSEGLNHLQVCLLQSLGPCMKYIGGTWMHLMQQ